MGINVGLSKHEPYLSLGGKIRPTEVDRLEVFYYLKPSVSDSAVMNTLSGTASAGTVTLAYPDYPRNLKATFTEASGTAWAATATVTGKDQFGNAVSEAFAHVNLGTSIVYGTKVFAEVTAVALEGASGAATDDVKIGYVIEAGTAKLGLFTKIGAANNVRRVHWVDNGVSTPGTVSIDTTYHAFKPGAAIAAADDYIAYVKPNYTTDDNEITNLGTSSLVS